MKILFITLPQRSAPESFPPYGALAVASYLRKHGYPDTHLYNIDLLRPGTETAIAHMVAEAPDVIAISSPVSTGFLGCRDLSLAIKTALPETIIVLGGNLAASAEVILKSTGVDVCVLGEGEIACKQFLDNYFPGNNTARLRNIRGLAYLENGTMMSSGYASQLPRTEIYDIDWDLLDESAARYYFPKLGSYSRNSNQWRYFSPINEDDEHQLPDDIHSKTIGVILSSKGCFNRCTYCHRFIKGLRIIPVPIVMDRISEMIRRFNIGAISFADECFGANKKWLKRFCEAITSYNLLWQVAGMRVDMVTPEIIDMMATAGCRTIIFGMESGSGDILKVMEKRVSLEANFNSAKWAVQKGMHTTVQLVIGMPGEDRRSISETAAYAGAILALSNRQSPLDISINYAQALPGTPLYEYGRMNGLVGRTLAEEEEYLSRISDRDASDREATLNFTDTPRYVAYGWTLQILTEINWRYARAHGRSNFFRKIFGNGAPPSLLAIIKTGKLHNIIYRYPQLFYMLGRWLWPIMGIKAIFKETSLRCWLSEMLAALRFSIGAKSSSTHGSKMSYLSLRKQLENDDTRAYAGSPAMVNLRKGQ